VTSPSTLLIRLRPVIGGHCVTLSVIVGMAAATRPLSFVRNCGARESTLHGGLRACSYEDATRAPSRVRPAPAA